MLIVSIRFSWASSLPRITTRIAKLGAKLKSGGEGSELNNRERWRKSKVEKFNVAEGRNIRSAVVKAEDDNGCASNAEGRVKGRLKETLPRLERSSAYCGPVGYVKARDGKNNDEGPEGARRGDKANG